MIRDYYGARRWDENGRVPEARLRELGLSGVEDGGAISYERGQDAER